MSAKEFKTPIFACRYSWVDVHSGVVKQGNTVICGPTPLEAVQRFLARNPHLATAEVCHTDVFADADGRPA